MVGSGPYRFAASERVPGSRAVYLRSESYVPRSGGAASLLAGPKVAHFDRVEWITLPDATTAAAALRRNEIDWWEQPTADLLTTLQRARGLKTDILDPTGTIGDAAPQSTSTRPSTTPRSAAPCSARSTRPIL